jgi:hypothetical protein
MHTLDTIKMQLTSLGFINQKVISNKKIAVLINSNRIDALQKIQKAIPGSVYNTIPTAGSSIGKVIVDGFNILAKPASKQGSASPGVENELILVNTIQEMVKTGPINVIFKGKNKSFEILGCKSARAVGADTVGRKKADIVLTDSKNKIYPISIKKDNAEIWESADTYFNQEAQKIIEKAINENKAKLVAESSYFKIEPNIAVKATIQEKRSVVFGSDIENNGGAVITKTFSTQSFTKNEDQLIIECSNIITNISDVTGDKDVYFLLRNDKTRKSIKNIPGIRILAVYKTRINRNVVILDR